MKLFKTSKGNLLQQDKEVFLVKEDWNTLINRENLYDYLLHKAKESDRLDDASFDDWSNHHLQAPIGTQELWAAGVTYMRSRDARIEESKKAGGGDFYDKVYTAERPELFFKSLPARVAAHNEAVCIRKDSTWNVPEPELTLFINANGTIQGYTIGNDMSSRSIEGENPLYLPQAKVYDRSAALGPCLLVLPSPLPLATRISISIFRNEQLQFSEGISLSSMKRSWTELASWLFRSCSFPDGCYLMTGTGMVPPDTFTLEPGDRIDISIEGIGVLTNKVELR
jgi:2-dehydro-3-deoxy-D-arabinonate dehydratase